MADVTTKNAVQNAATDVAKTEVAQQQPKQSTRKAPGLQVKRMFTKPGVSPYSEVEWEVRVANISDASGGTIFEQKDVEVPKDWSMTATNIVASKYLHGKVGTSERETGVRQPPAGTAGTSAGTRV